MDAQLPKGHDISEDKPEDKAETEAESPILPPLPSLLLSSATSTVLQDCYLIVPPDIQHILDTIESHGYSAYLVGGCVRDSLRGIPYKDIDIVTSCPKEILAKIFPRQGRWDHTHPNLFKLRRGIDILVSTAPTLEIDASSRDIDDNALYCDKL